VTTTRPAAPEGRLPTLFDRPIVQKWFKYSMTSVVGVILGQSLIFLFASIVKMGWGWANLWAVVLSTIPTYYMTRSWVWSKSGKSSLYAEVIPFWVLTFLGLGLSTLFVWIFHRSWPDNKLLVNVGNISGFGVLWVAKFFILDRLLFKVAHEHIDTPTPVL